ncbi:MAG: hypothetical protein ACYDIA_19195 [Candidatus Humimicrobiaceae bacterium]
MKKHNSITLKLQGDRITSDKLKTGIGAFYGFVDEIASQIYGVKNPIKWIVRVKEGSIVLVNEPELSENLDLQKQDKVFDFIQKGIDVLEKEAQCPPFFNDRALEFLENLVSLPSYRGNGLTGVDIYIDDKKNALTQHIIANVDILLGVYSKALGSIEGRLQTLSARGSLKFIVYDALTDKGTYCYIGEELFNEAIQAFDKRVYVYGTINYDNKGNPKSIKVEEMKIFENKDKLPSAFDVCGILQGMD